MATTNFRQEVAGYYIDDASGVQIIRGESGRWFVYTVVPGFQSNHLAAGRATLAQAKVAAKAEIAQLAARRDADHAEALAEYAKRAKVGDDETIHFHDGEMDEPTACGVDLYRTSYTYASPFRAEVDCPACLAAVPPCVWCGRPHVVVGCHRDPLVITTPLTHAAEVDRIRADWENYEIRASEATNRIQAATGVTLKGAQVLLCADSTAALADG